MFITLSAVAFIGTMELEGPTEARCGKHVQREYASIF
jgi:hypothetical protein